MSGYHSSQDPNWDKTHDQAKETKRPEFVILEDDRQEEETLREGESYYQTLLKLKLIHFGIGSRIFAAFIFLVLILVTLIFSISFIFAGLAYIVTLGKVDTIEQTWESAWKLFRRLLTYIVSAFVGIFSPSLGIGIVFLYHILQNERLNKTVFSRFINRKNSFYN